MKIWQFVSTDDDSNVLEQFVSENKKNKYKIYIYYNYKQPVGNLRLEYVNNYYKISYLIDQKVKISKMNVQKKFKESFYNQLKSLLIA